MKKQFIIHPFLFAIFPILFLYSYNITEMLISEIFPFTLITFVFVLSFFIALTLVLKDKQKAGLVVSIFLVFFFSYGHFFDLLIKNKAIGPAFGLHRILLSFWGVLFICSAYFIIISRKNLFDLTKIINFTAAFLVMLPLANIVIYKLNEKPFLERKISVITDERSVIQDQEVKQLPDIYYITLDGYASSDILRDIFSYDNREFIDYLTGKGFYVADESRSNYAMTSLSLASSLNMEYVNYLTDILGEESKNGRIILKMIKDSKVARFLKTKGYKIVYFNSGWRVVGSNPYADLDIECGSWDEFHIMLIKTTLLRPFVKYLIEEDVRKRILFTFFKLGEMHKIKGPKFIFAHIVCPHPPYLFGSSGELVSEEKSKKYASDWENKNGYLNQLIFVNKKIKSLVGEILSKSKVHPIIILQADHGTCSTFYSSDGKKWPEYPTDKNIRERFRIFNAYYLPSGGDRFLYDSITPVNTFRLIFKFYFNRNEELLGDQSYYSTYKFPFKLINVTEKACFN